MNKPAIGEHVHRVGTLVAIEEIPPEPKPPQVDYIFEEIHAKCKLMRKGKFIDELGSYNDFYGYETSIKTAIEEMREYCLSLCSFKLRVQIRLKNKRDVIVGKITDVYEERFQLLGDDNILQQVRYAWVAKIKNA